jgi:hypothetical protein
MNKELAEIIIKTDKSDYRFELFALDICSQEHGVTFLPTSQSWDRGRDGRTRGSSSSGFDNLLCSTLNTEVDGKIEADLLRITATSSPRHLIYCSSQPLSEHHIDGIDKMIRRHVPGGTITIYGALQLAKLSEIHSKTFEKHYFAEVESIRTSLIEEPKEEEKLGLRLALITLGCAHGPMLRTDVLHSLILEILKLKGPQTPQEISGGLSTDLGLPRPLPLGLIEDALKREHGEQTIALVNWRWQLTAYGEQELARLPIQSADYLLEGRNAIRTKLESLVGFHFPEQQYKQIWSSFLDFLATLFYENGLSVIHAIDSYLGSSEMKEEPDLKELLVAGAVKCASMCASTPESIVRLKNAILDTLTERTGPAFEWLTRTCERFVTLCCLGLESTSSTEVRRSLTASDTVLDSDIVLNYLCEGEPDHAATKELLANWRSAGGQILASPVVLEEVAYHAWISQRDFVETRHMLGTLKPYERSRFIRNAFVRSFHAVSTKPEQWDIYISQYRGNSETDYSRIRQKLVQRLQVQVLPDNYDKALADEIAAYALEYKKREGDYEADEAYQDRWHKRNRDGHLLAAIHAARNAAAERDSSANIILLSSSQVLRAAERKFLGRLGNRPFVFSSRAFAYMISMMPNVQLAADSLRRALFEFGYRAKLSDAERRALRIIRSSGAYDLPWGDRDLLKQQLSGSIHRQALATGVPDAKIRGEFNSGAVPETSAAILADALKNLAKGSADATRLQAAEQKILELETELARTNAALRIAAKKPAR